MRKQEAQVKVVGRVGFEVPNVPKGLLIMSHDSRAPLRAIIKVQRMVKGTIKKVKLVQRGFTFCIWPVREAPHCCMYNLFFFFMKSMGSWAYVGVPLIEILNKKKGENPGFPTFFHLCDIQIFRLASCPSPIDKPHLSPQCVLCKNSSPHC